MDTILFVDNTFLTEPNVQLLLCIISMVLNQTDIIYGLIKFVVA